MNFYAFHIGDYATDTRHLSWDEDMAYRRMLDCYYSREQPLPLERRHLYRLVNAAEPRQREAVDAVLQEFFEERADGWYNNRADEELAKMREKQEKARACAKLSVASRQRSDRSATVERPLSERSADAHTEQANASENTSEGSATITNTNTNKERENARALRIESLLKENEGKLDDWEVSFLHSISEKTRLTAAQVESLKGMEAWAKIRKWPAREQRHPDGTLREGWYFPTEWPPDHEPSSPP